MKVLIDTNIILDVLCAREFFLPAAAKVWKLCELNKIEGYISALSVPNIVYILRKELNLAKTQQVIEQLFLIFKVVDLRADDLMKAAKMQNDDFEDTLQMLSALHIKADYIITRNVRDFQNSKVKAILPTEILEKFSLP